MSILPISIPAKKLAASITSTDSSFRVNNILGWNGVALTTADLGSQHFVVFINDTRTLMEIIEIDPATIASSSITILKRGLKFDGTETEVTANKLNWPANETTVLFGTDVPQLLNNFVDKAREQTLTGLKSVPTPTSDYHIATKKYVDDTANSGTVTHDRLTVAGNAGETVAAGNLVYFDDTDNEWKKCDADTAASVNNVMLGIAQGAGVNGGAISGGVLIKGIDDNQTGLTAGALYYASNTAGGISTSTGTTERVIGFARTTTSFYFDSNFYYITTANQKAAMAGGGDLGTPSTSNKFQTQEGVVAALGDVTVPSTRLFSNIFGSSTTQFDITNPAGTTFRYTWDTTGTDPSISATTVPIGTTLVLAAQNFAAGNNGSFVITGSGSNYFEVTNASGVVESNKTIGTGSIKYGYTKATNNPKYIVVEVVGGGGGGEGGHNSGTDDIAGAGGAGGGYSKKIISFATLGATETLTIGAGGGGGAGATDGTQGGTTTFGSLLQATGGGGGSNQNGGLGGVGSLGDLNITGGDGSSTPGTDSAGGTGGSSVLGGGGAGGEQEGGQAGNLYGGGGGGGGGVGLGGDVDGGVGAVGAVIITEYYV